MTKFTWKGFVTESTINSVEYGLLCSSKSSTPLEVASPIPDWLLPEGTPEMDPEDVFPDESDENKESDDF